MPFLVMLFLTLACLPESWPAPRAGIGSPLVSVLLTWAGTGLVIGLAFVVTRRAVAGYRDGLLGHEQALRGYSRGRFYHQIALFGTYLVALYGFGYGWAVHSLWAWRGHVLPGAELVLLAPFFAGLVCSWVCFYDAERALWGDSEEEGQRTEDSGQKENAASVGLSSVLCPSSAGRWSYVAFHFRQHLALVFLPVLLLIGEKELRRQFPAVGQEWEMHASILGVCAALGVFVTMPWVLRLVLGLRPLPAGPLRSRLTATARRLRFRCSDILLWNTRGGVANAMVVGVLPFLRYVILSDKLVAELGPEEVEAVFGHEVGHVKHHHMPFYLVFLMASIAVLGMAALPYQARIEEALSMAERRDLAVLPVVGSLGAYVFLVFGFLSRRCERQADIYGCRAVSCSRPICAGHAADEPLPDRGGGLCPTGVHTFVQALEKVALLNGMSRDRPGFLQSWQHSTIARRVHFLQSLASDPGAERRFQRRVLLVKCGLFALLGAVFIVQIV